MIKMMIATRRRPGMTHAEFTAYNVDIHGAIVRSHTATIRRYVQNDIYDGAFGRTGDSDFSKVVMGRDNVTELYFDGMNALIVAASDPEITDRQFEDGRNYAERETVIAMVATETELKVAHPGGGRLKVYHFLRRRNDVSERDFSGLWLATFERTVIASGNTPHLRRATWSEPAPAGKPLTDAMGTSQDYHGYSTFWYDREEAGAATFRAYIDVLENLSDSPIEHSSSFFVLAREQVIFDHS